MKLALGLSILLLAGCAHVPQSPYIASKNPYTREVYGDFPMIVQTAKKVLADRGWTIERISHPAVFERNERYEGAEGDHIVIFATKKNSSMLIMPRTHQLNLFVYSVNGGAEIEIRYRRVVNAGVKKVTYTRNDPLVEKILSAIQEQLKS